MPELQEEHPRMGFCSQNFTGWARLGRQSVWDSVGSLNPKMDGNRCLKSLKSSFHLFSARNPMGRNGLKYVWVIPTAEHSIAHSAQVRVQMPDGTKNMCLV